MADRDVRAKELERALPGCGWRRIATPTATVTGDADTVAHAAGQGNTINVRF